jgi:hypothetical protein
MIGNHLPPRSLPEVYMNSFDYHFRSLFILLSILLLAIVITSGSRAMADSIDVMIVFDTTAQKWIKDTKKTTIQAFSQAVITKMNLALKNSGINNFFRLRHCMSTDYTSTTYLDEDSDFLKQNEYFVKARKDYGADLVTMFIAPKKAFCEKGKTDECDGLGSFLTEAKGDKNQAFSVSLISVVENDHTQSHEWGHQLGGDHAIDQKPEDQPGPNPLASYAAGWYFADEDDNQYHTIMAYDRDKDDVYYDLAPVFSNPYKQYKKTNAGDEKRGHNVKLMNKLWNKVAKYFPETDKVSDCGSNVEEP